MSGGMAFVHDADGTFEQRVNGEMVDLEPLQEDDQQLLRQMLRNPSSYTSSKLALAMLNDWETTLQHFIKVMPRDYKAVLERKQEKPNIAVKVAPSA